jgi:hypothetical protein
MAEMDSPLGPVTVMFNDCGFWAQTTWPIEMREGVNVKLEVSLRIIGLNVSMNKIEVLNEEKIDLLNRLCRCKLRRGIVTALPVRRRSS